MDAIVFHGDHHPVEVYEGSSLLYTPATTTASGSAMVLESTYNDSVEVTVEGVSTQDGVPTPDSPVPIVSRTAPSVTASGRNMLDISGETREMRVGNGYYNDVTSRYGSYNFINTPFNLRAGKKYTFAVRVDSELEPFNISIGTGTGAFLRDVASLTGRYSGWHVLQFIPTAFQLSVGDILAFRPCRYSTRQSVNYTFAKAMLLEGWQNPTEDDYEEYKGSTIDLSSYLDGRTLRSLPDGTRDTLELRRRADGRADVVLVERVHHQSTKGKNVYKYGGKTEGIPCYVFPSLDYDAYCNGGETANKNILSNMYTFGYAPWKDGAADFKINTTTKIAPKYIYVSDSRFDTQEDFKAWNNEVGFEIDYRLATPIETVLATIDSLPSHYPATTVWTGDGSDVEAGAMVWDESTTVEAAATALAEYLAE